MAYSHYERLSALDMSFLSLEDRNTHMHIGAVSVFEAAPLTRSDGGVDIDRIHAAMEAGIHRVPRYRQRLARMPVVRHPVWVDDATFNLQYHLRHTQLPRPGGDRQLKRLAGRVLSQQLDRGKPPWEMWVVEGLAGDRFAIISKVHHCMIDGGRQHRAHRLDHAADAGSGPRARASAAALDPASGAAAPRVCARGEIGRRAIRKATARALRSRCRCPPPRSGVAPMGSPTGRAAARWRAPGSENIEVPSSHLGMGHHPVVLLTIADRLAQPEGDRRRFTPPSGWRWPLAPRVRGAAAGGDGHSDLSGPPPPSVPSPSGGNPPR
jgi:WS/DGAT/MGAT family acyltransferase